jgi:predicted nucleic acid-binding protein
MIINRFTRVFVDASCFVAACGRPQGGSGYIVSLFRRGLLRAVSSHPVLLEAERNIAQKLGAVALDTFHQSLIDSLIEIVPVPDEYELRVARHVAGAKDDHVLAAAVACGAPFLLSLDRKLIRAVYKAELSILAIDPASFIIGVLPAHKDYDLLRD